MVGHAGQEFDAYRLLRRLGEGSYGVVYLGEHRSSGEQVAIKLLKFNLTADRLKKFLTEARTIRLKHPHIVQLLDFGVADDTPFLVLEYAVGGNLRDQHPKGTRVPLALAFSYVSQLASALEYAHDMRLVHRDVKPENMLLGVNEQILVSDFGSAIFTPFDRSLSAKSMIGTVVYMAPEQLRGKAYPASDQYSLGIAVYEWLCGVRPFQGSLEAIINQQSFTPPPPLRERVPELPAAVEAVVLKALAKDPQQRFASVQDFAIALEQASQPTELRKLPAELVRPPPSLPVEVLTPPGTAQAKQTGMSEVATGEQLLPASTDDEVEAEETAAPVWNVPYGRNAFFTGREELLSLIEESLGSGPTSSCALCGLGGIGKTQSAVEYAYRSRERHGAVFWVRAASRETLIADYLAMAELLHLVGRQGQDQMLMVAMVKGWLTHHDGWLLILDNADDLALLSDFLPAGGKGHTLLTTRAQATGALARRLSVEKLDVDESMQLLLRRAGLLPPAAPLDSVPLDMLSTAQKIVQALDGLPLALDQAGAYIEETECSLPAYLRLYRQRRKDLLRRRGAVSPDYPHTVASTWSLAFQQVQAANPAAAELLHLCAFLDPDVIPEVILTEGAALLGPVLAPVAADPFNWNEAIQGLRRYSLVNRDAELEILNVHRLVQVVLRQQMEEREQRQWAERAVRLVERAFPKVSYETWPRCELCLPHALACAELIEEYGLAFRAAQRLLLHAGSYLLERSQYPAAEPLLVRALALCERTAGPEHHDTAIALDQLANLYNCQGRYTEAEPLLQRALAIGERALVPGHPETATILTDLGWLYRELGQYARAEPLLQRALAIRESGPGSEPHETAETLQTLAWMYQQWGRYREAEPLLVRALALCERTLGPDHPDTAETLSTLGWLYFFRGQYEQALRSFERALAIFKRTVGPDHPDTAEALKDVAFLYQLQGRYAEAEPLFHRALAIAKHVYGPHHPCVASFLADMGQSFLNQGRYAEAEPLLQRALAISEQANGPSHPETAICLNNLGRCAREQGQYTRAEALFHLALSIREQTLGPEHSYTAISRFHLGVLYRQQGRYAEAEPLFLHALAVYERTLDPNSPRISELLEDYAVLLHEMQRSEEEARLHARLAAMRARRGATPEGEYSTESGS